MLKRALGLLLSVVTAASAFAPAHAVHEMTGRMMPDGAAAVGIVSMRLDCVFYEEGPECRGRWRCKKMPHDGAPSSSVCRQGSARAILDVASFNGDDPLSRAAGMSLYLPDGTYCRFTGTVPFVFGTQVPAVSGRYDCQGQAGTAVEQGLFGFRSRAIGQRFYRFD